MACGTRSSWKSTNTALQSHVRWLTEHRTKQLPGFPLRMWPQFPVWVVSISIPSSQPISRSRANEYKNIWNMEYNLSRAHVTGRLLGHCRLTFHRRAALKGKYTLWMGGYQAVIDNSQTFLLMTLTAAEGRISVNVWPIPQSYLLEDSEGPFEITSVSEPFIRAAVMCHCYLTVHSTLTSGSGNESG